MINPKKGKWISYAIAGGICLLMAAAYALSYDLGALGWKDRYLVLCDAFTLPGMLMLAAGGIGWLAYQGALDGVTYILRYVASMLIPGKAYWRGNYRDFLDAQQEKRRGGYGFLLITGLVCMVITGIFLVLYFQTPA